MVRRQPFVGQIPAQDLEESRAKFIDGAIEPNGISIVDAVDSATGRKMAFALEVRIPRESNELHDVLSTGETVEGDAEWNCWLPAAKSYSPLARLDILIKKPRHLEMRVLIPVSEADAIDHLDVAAKTRQVHVVFDPPAVPGRRSLQLSNIESELFAEALAAVRAVYTDGTQD